jgi:hypothetical protein
MNNFLSLTTIGLVALPALGAGDFNIDAERDERMKELVREVLADADSRSSFQGNAGPVTLDVHGFGIFRWQYNNGGGLDRTNEFSLPYERLEFSGDVYDWGYMVSGEFSDSNSGDFELVDAYVTGSVFTLDFKAGQFVSPFFKGYTDSPLDQVTGEYSVIATTFGQGRSQGVSFSKDVGSLTLSAAYNDGFDTANGTALADNDWGMSLRADYDLGAGFNLGAAYAYQESVSDYNTYTVDASYTNGGLMASMGWVASSTDSGYSDNYGFVGTLAYQCTDSLQGFMQYEHGRSGAGNSDLNLLTVGANYDLARGVRWTNSVGYALDAVEGWDTSRSGWNSSSTDGELLITSQISISF